MSSVYNLEPPPTAKVILQTTAGDIALELFAKQTPLASRNFLQHCLDGYYNGTIFHRLVPGFIIQGGDPTGTGAGGESAINNGDAFADEFHSRLKFNRRGLVGMANEGKNTNASQFFFTLGATPELQGNNTMFGRVEGDTIYNLMKMAEAELTEGEGSERPLYPTKITGAEILVNPFEDMVARVKEAPRTRVEVKSKELKKRKKPAGKNVLSFAADEDDEENAAPVLKKSKANPKLVSVGAGDQQDREIPTPETNAAKASEKKPARRRRSSTSSSTKDEQPNGGSNKNPVIPQAAPAESPTSSPEAEPPSKSQTALEKTNAEIAALKASMKRRIDPTVTEQSKPKNALEAMIPATSTRGRKRGKMTDEKGALDLFKAFKQRLEGLPDESVDEAVARPNGHAASATENAGAPSTDAADDEAELCDLHFIANCQSCKSWDAENADGEVDGDGDDDVGWMAHALSFAKDTMGKDLEWKKKMAEIEVIDPREKARAIKEEQRRDKGKGKAGK